MHQFWCRNMIEGLDMYAEITAAIQSTKTAIELVKAAHGLSQGCPIKI